MKSPKGKPLFETHCRICGGALIVNARKRRTSLFSRRSWWDLEKTCSSCGNQSGGTVGIVEFGSQGRTTRVLGAVRRLLSGIPLMNNRPEHSRGHGVANLRLPYCELSSGKCGSSGMQQSGMPFAVTRHRKDGAAMYLGFSSARPPRTLLLRLLA